MPPPPSLRVAARSAALHAPFHSASYPAAIAVPLWILLIPVSFRASSATVGRLVVASVCLLLALHAAQPAPLQHPPLAVAPHLHPAVRQITQPLISPLPLPPPPSPQPSPSPPPEQDQPPAQAPPPTEPAPIPDAPISPGETIQVDAAPALTECSGGLKRMQVILLLELCFEILFVFLLCLVAREHDDEPSATSSTDSTPPIQMNFRAFLVVRAIYLVPVLILNSSIYWVGGGPTGGCISNYSEVQIPFVHLVFYLLFCILVVLIGALRLTQWSESSEDTLRSPAYRSNGPPTRTSSYYRWGRPARRTSSTSYTEPKVRCNLGCCAFNF